jgi:hypothetical protein
MRDVGSERLSAPTPPLTSSNIPPARSLASSTSGNPVRYVRTCDGLTVRRLESDSEGILQVWSPELAQLAQES